VPICGVKLLLRALAVLALIGCLGAAAAAAAPTRPEYIAQVDPICQQGQKEVAHLTRHYVPSLKAGNYKRAARILLRGLRRYKALIDTVAQVEPPAEDAALIAQWLSLEREDIAVSRKIASAIRRERFGAWHRAVKKSKALEREIRALIAGYAFEYCGYS